VAGFWIAAPQKYFPETATKLTMKFMSVVIALGALFQALPDRGFWHGGNANALTQMTKSMTATPQPHVIAWFANHVGDLAGSMGGGFNIVVILWLLVSAAGLWFAADRHWHWPVATFVVGAVLFWFAAEDAAIYGGLATDLNSLIPMAALVWCLSPRFATGVPLPRQLPREMRAATGLVFSSFASAMIIFSIVTMSIAPFLPSETTLFMAANGTVVPAHTTAPVFTLTDQHGATYTLGEHPGRVTVLTFLDPRCWTDCPLLAAQLQTVRTAVGKSAKIDIVAVAADPYHEEITDVNHFIGLHHLGSMANFYFVTGKLAAVKKVWNSYGIGVTMKPTDRMSIHSDYVFIIGEHGKLRWIIPDDPIGTWAGQNSASTEIENLLRGIGIN
jgi:cytochrome oxidase Cu insertion factor (SCO1/SenC/PrrC family)